MLNLFLHKLSTGILATALGISSFLSPTAPQDIIRPIVEETAHNALTMTKNVVLGAAPQFVSGKLYTLYGSGVNSTNTSITLTSFTLPVTNTPITTADLIGGVGDVFYITIDPQFSSRKEFVSCTDVIQNANGTATLTGCTRGLAFSTPYTASTSLRQSHAGGSRVVISNAPQLYQSIIDYIDNASIAGAVDASAIAKGIVEVATGNEAASHASTGSGDTTAPLTLTTAIASSTRTANTAQVVVSSSTDGYIDSSYINPIFASSTTIGSFPAFNIGKDISVVTSTSSETAWPVPSGVTKVWVRLVGGGGGGGGVDNGSAQVAAGGGGGGYSEKMCDITGLTTIGVRAGAEGSRGPAGGSGTGGTATESYFGACTSATGGGGGIGRSSAFALGGTGGVASTTANRFDFGFAGQPGSYGFAFTGGSARIGGMGGHSAFGSGANNNNSASAAGVDCATSTNGYGGGGGGATGNSANFTGGLGCPGIVIISW